MRIDFHFYTIYALARSSGFNPDDAYVIAYSSQYTDDAVDEKRILFEDRDYIDQIMTSHKVYDPSTLLDRTCRMVWVPFHFLPGNEGTDFFERMAAKADGYIAKEIIRRLLETPRLTYSLHLLGIILHAYADTWSHQNFLGLRHDMNNISDLKIFNQDISEYTPTDIDILNLGHVQAGHIPDEPYIDWEYKDYKGELLTISNTERTLRAAKCCYDLLLNFFNKFPKFEPFEIIPWENITGKLKELFSFSGDIKRCEKIWKSAISNGEIGFTPSGRDLNIDYNENDWFELAIDERRVVEGDNEFTVFEKKIGYESSGWKHFNEAASFYRSDLFFRICNEIGLEIMNNI